MTDTASLEPPPGRDQDVDAEPDQLRDWLGGAEACRSAQRNTLGEIRYADSAEARATLAELAKCVGMTLDLEAKTARTANGRTVPATTWEAASSSQDITAAAVTAAAESLLTSRSNDAAANAVLVVGHQPMLGRLADTLPRPASKWQRLVRGASSTPIDQSGIVCLARDPTAPRWAPKTWVVWAISFDEAAAEEVRVKVGARWTPPRRSPASSPWVCHWSWACC